jgi:hypothetical protein
MLFGRLIGWGLLGLALLMASGDVVMALGPGDHVGLVTADVWVLLAGRVPHAGSLATLPAWTLLAPAGAALLWTCRSRRRRYRFRSVR